MKYSCSTFLWWSKVVNAPSSEKHTGFCGTAQSPLGPCALVWQCKWNGHSNEDKLHDQKLTTRLEVMAEFFQTVSQWDPAQMLAMFTSSVYIRPGRSHQTGWNWHQRSKHLQRSTLTNLYETIKKSPLHLQQSGHLNWLTGWPSSSIQTLVTINSNTYFLFTKNKKPQKFPTGNMKSAPLEWGNLCAEHAHNDWSMSLP